MWNRVYKMRSVIIIVAILSIFLWYIWPILFGGGFNDITRQNRGLIRQMKYSTHGRLIKKVIMTQYGSIDISVYVKSSAKDEEVLALAEDIKLLINDNHPNPHIDINLFLRHDGFDKLYDIFRRPLKDSDEIEWFQSWPVPTATPTP